MTIESTRLRGTLAIGALSVAALALGGCVAKDAPAGDKSQDSKGKSSTISVVAGDDGCEVAESTATSGVITFEVANKGSKVNEFYVLGENKLTIIGEVENIAPGGEATLTVQANPGTYYTQCKPGMIGAGIGQAVFTVSGEKLSVSPQDKEVVAQYVAYVKTQTEELVPKVEEFVAAYKSGDDEKAKKLFPDSRINYERIEPTAEQFGDLDPKIDYRKPGADEEGLPFTGFHRIEMDLWNEAAVAGGDYPGDKDLTPLTPEERAKLGDQLVADVTELKDKVASPDFELTLADITEGAKGLLDEVAAPDGKLPGEENEFAHTDLWDFYANVEGSYVAFDTVRELAEANGAKDLVAELDKSFAGMFSLLESYGSYEKGFVFYDTVGDKERSELAAKLNAVSEPMSKLTAAVVKN